MAPRPLQRTAKIVFAAATVLLAALTALVAVSSSANAVVDDQSGGQTWAKNGLTADDSASPGLKLTLTNPSNDVTWKRTGRENNKPGTAGDHFETRGMAVVATISGVNLCLEPDVPSCARSMKIDRTLSWQVHLARGGSLKLAQDINNKQVVNAYNAQGVGYGGFVIPWAKDAEGRTLTTSFSLKQLSGGDWQLNQRIHNTSYFKYPVKADPDFDWGIISGHIYFNKFETQEVVNQAFTIGAICGVITAFYPPAGAACIAEGAEFYAEARYAVDTGQCLSYNLGPPTSFYPDHYNNDEYDYCY